MNVFPFNFCVSTKRGMSIKFAIITKNVVKSGKVLKMPNTGAIIVMVKFELFYYLFCSSSHDTII